MSDIYVAPPTISDPECLKALILILGDSRATPEHRAEATRLALLLIEKTVAPPTLRITGTPLDLSSLNEYLHDVEAQERRG